MFSNHQYDLHTFANVKEKKYPARIITVVNSKFNVIPGAKKLPNLEFSKDLGVLSPLAKQLGLGKKANDAVCIRHNLSNGQLRALFEAESQRKELENVGMLIVIIMSYGYTGHIYDCNRRPVEVDKLMEYFRGMRCTALVGKPKLFIVQACEEGDLYQEVDTVADSVSSRPPTTCYMPSEADFLTFWSPIPGQVSWRNYKEDGSIFFSKLKEVFSPEAKEYEGMEIRKLMTRVIQMVCEELEEHNHEDFEASGFRLPYMIDMFTKELYFHTAKAAMLDSEGP